MHFCKEMGDSRNRRIVKVLTEPPTQILSHSNVTGDEVVWGGLLEQTIYPAYFVYRIESGIVEAIGLT
jgi:hypothetical protein